MNTFSVSFSQYFFRRFAQTSKNLIADGETAAPVLYDTVAEARKNGMKGLLSFRLVHDVKKTLEAGGKANWDAELKAEHLPFEGRVVLLVQEPRESPGQWEPVAVIDHPYDQPVCELRAELEKDRTYEEFVHGDCH